jgi:hypothetical protein
MTQLMGGDGWRVTAWRCGCCPDYHNIWGYYSRAPDSHISNADYGSKIFQSIDELAASHPHLTPICVDNQEVLLADYLARHAR